MTGCNHIRKQIDEADRPEAISYEASDHMASCADCRSFASERASLRQLLASPARITVPSDFDAELSRRLRERTARREFSLWGSALYLRFGAAAAMLLVAVFAAQYTGFISGTDPAPVPGTDMAAAGDDLNRQSKGEDQEEKGNRKKEITAQNITPPPSPDPPLLAEVNQVRGRRPNPPRATASAAPPDVTAADIPVVIVMGRDGEIEVPIPTVNVGAQSLLYANAGRQPVRTVRASF